jgi:hypothetical protein
MAITSLRTRCGDIEFRSRLEARWSVFLDGRGIKWEYEPRWFHWRSPVFQNWLPDFRLSTGQWAEVKGSLDERETTRLLFNACRVSVCGKGNDVVVLGPLPGRRQTGWPMQLHYHDRLIATPWDLSPECPVSRGATYLDTYGDIDEIRECLLDGFDMFPPRWAWDFLTGDPFKNAREARVRDDGDFW